MKILMQKRGMTRVQSILYGIKNRARCIGLPRSIAKTISILAIDSFRSLLFTILRISLVYPAKIIIKCIGLFRPRKPSSFPE